MCKRLKLVFLLIFIISFSLVAGNINKYELKDGDIIFHISLSSQSKAIQLATDSKYSHCGIIYEKNNKYYVLEAVQPVKLTNLEDWIARGKDKHFVIKRLKNRGQILTSQRLQKMQSIGENFLGKNYDLTFEWSDKNIYCSELIWKIYKQGANIEVGKLEKLKDFNLSNKIVKEKLKERYGDKIPINETVISPKSIFESDLLYTVTEY